MKEYTLLITLSILCLCACQTKTEKTTDSYNTSLVESKKSLYPLKTRRNFSVDPSFSLKKTEKNSCPSEYSKRGDNMKSSYST